MKSILSRSSKHRVSNENDKTYGCHLDKNGMKTVEI
jgi:hypothetical protein